MFYRWAIRCVAIVSTLLPTGVSGGADPAAEAPLPKVLILGDSISIGYTGPVRKSLEGVADVRRPNTNCQHTAYGLAQIKNWLGDEKWDVIHFNWGIWDTHMLDEKGTLVRNEANYPGKLHVRHTPEQYCENLTELVKILEGTGAKLVWASTTPMLWRTGDRFEEIPSRNAIAAEIMRAHHIPIDDLYEFVLPHAKEWQNADKVHFNAAGNEALGRQVSQSIRQALAPQPAKATKP